MTWRRRDLLAASAASASLMTVGCGAPASVTIAPPSNGLDFPGSTQVRRTMRFRFTRPLAIYPATYIWRALPRRQAGYYTAFFWGNDDGLNDLRTFLWTPERKADAYYGAHPYPQPAPDGNNHRWEISILQDDLLGAPVEYDRWHTQGFRAWPSPLGKHHEFYWDLPLTSAPHRINVTAPAHWGDTHPPQPTLTWGDAPWAPGKEVWNGVLSGIQIYQACLSVDEMLQEAALPGSTKAGKQSLWYLNTMPRPDDISDQSGNGNHPEWVGPERPTLWRAAHG